MTTQTTISLDQSIELNNFVDSISKEDLKNSAIVVRKIHKTGLNNFVDRIFVKIVNKAFADGWFESTEHNFRFSWLYHDLQKYFERFEMPNEKAMDAMCFISQYLSTEYKDTWLELNKTNRMAISRLARKHCIDIDGLDKFIKGKLKKELEQALTIKMSMPSSFISEARVYTPRNNALITSVEASVAEDPKAWEQNKIVINGVSPEFAAEIMTLIHTRTRV